MCSVCASFKGIVVSDTQSGSRENEHSQDPPVSHKAEETPEEQEVGQEQEGEHQRFKESVNSELHENDLFHPFDLEDNESNGGFHPIITGRKEQYRGDSESEEEEGDNNKEKLSHLDDEWESINSADEEEDGQKESTTSNPSSDNDSHLEDSGYTYIASSPKSNGSLNDSDPKTAMEVNPKTNRKASSDTTLEVNAEANPKASSIVDHETASHSQTIYQEEL